MKKTWKLTGFDCGVCAAKAERAIRKIDGVQDVSINLITERLSLEFDGDESRILEEAARVCRKIEPGCTLFC